MNEFQKARFKLTLWYILINLVLLTIFSLSAISAEQKAFSLIQASLSDPIQRPRLTALLANRINGFENNFRQRLLTFDLILLFLSSIAGYFLSGRTLRPIASMVKYQQEFAADASHELRTPLTTINLEIESLKRNGKYLEPRYRQTLDSINEEVGRMSGIVDGLLTLVREGEVNHQSNRQYFNFSQVITEVFTQLNSLAKNKSLNYQLNSQDNITVFGDPIQLKKLVVILIDNAIKYTPVKGRVIVSLKKNGRFLTFSISDSGCGISEQDLPHIFKRFYRGSTIRTQKGSGLGLTIAKKIIDYHDGKISVESKLGHGSKFTVTLST